MPDIGLEPMTSRLTDEVTHTIATPFVGTHGFEPRMVRCQPDVFTEVSLTIATIAGG